MSQTTIPRTPTPDQFLDDYPESQSSLQQMIAMTPPPSSQLTTRTGLGNHFIKEDISLASPPPTLRNDPPISSGMLFGEVPTADAVDSMSEGELRRLISELLPALGEARVTAAHSKLQHSLLTIESAESIKRAEVEQEAMKREVQVLQENSPAINQAFTPLASPQLPTNKNLQLAFSHCRDLQHENHLLEKRLRSSKKLIAELDGENADLRDQLQFLRQRIKENRDHINDLQESGAMSLHGTPKQDFSTPYLRDNPRTPATGRMTREIGSNQTNRSRNAFDALLQAVNLNEETISVPSTPQHRQRKLHSHMRGAYSMSSLPVTPEQRRPLTAEAARVTPSERNTANNVSFSAGPKLHYEQVSQRDRESTISASDNESDGEMEEGLGGSQASQMASSMLRRTFEAQNERASPASRQSSQGQRPTQSRISGQIQKPRGAAQSNPLKRKAVDDGFEDTARGSVRAKTSHLSPERIGLGIGSLASPTR